MRKINMNTQLNPPFLQTAVSGCFSEIFNTDCIELMKRYPDNYFDLAVVDPPYGMIGNVFQMKSKNLLKEGQTSARLDDKNSSIGFDLNKPPGQECFDELFRVSKNQIVFGMQYFTPFLPKTQCVIVWDKVNGGSYFSDAEIAWTSFKTAVRLARIHNPSNNRIHPTQKAIKLYDYIFQNYAKEGDIILDTHLGSGSSRISAHKAKLNFIGCEINKEYYDESQKRYDEFICQTRLF